MEIGRKYVGLLLGPGLPNQQFTKVAVKHRLRIKYYNPPLGPNRLQQADVKADAQVEAVLRTSQDLTQKLVLGNSRQQQAQVEEAAEDLVVVVEDQYEIGGKDEEEEKEEVMVADAALDHLFGQCFLNGGDEDFAILEQQVIDSILPDSCLMIV